MTRATSYAAGTRTVGRVVDLRELDGVDVRPVPFALDHFAAADGRVFSCARAGVLRERRPNSNRGGYLQLSVERLGAFRRYTVGSFVAAAFLAPRPSLAHQLRHLNGNKLDNRAVNLAWGTAQENIDDRERHGTTARGERVGTAVLTAKEVAAIKRGLVGGASKASLARAFGVSWPCIDHIARGDNWNHVTAED